MSEAVAGAPPIELIGLNKWFGAFHVLKDIDLRVQEGERIVVCGPSGSGKSTMIRCINQLESHQEGTIRIHGRSYGRDVRENDAIRREIGMVFQSFNLWSHMSVIDNVMAAPLQVQGRDKGDVRAEALAMLEKVGIAQKADAFPAQLSGGQQQRAAIARALCINPRLMLFDEPTSALDPELEGEVLRVIRLLAEEGRTMVLVTHDMEFARSVARRAVFLHEGRIEEEGPVQDVFCAPRSPRLQRFLAAGKHA